MKVSIKLLLVSLLSIAATAQLHAANPVKGTVTDPEGNPVIGAAVIEVGTTNGVVVDFDGSYAINVASANSVLQFSCIGYTTVEEKVGTRGTIDVILVESTSFLQETVVVGYGTQKKADITSSVQSVKAEDFNAGSVLDAGQLIQGKVAGLNVTISSGDPTASSSIMLRGYSSLLGTTDPLVLVDGVPGNLNTVAAEDIESIDVLKDGSATAIYGTRGTNGVIIITTKSAKRDMPATVTYNGYVSASTWAKAPDFMKADDVRALWEKGITMSGANDKDRGASTDWLDEVSRTAVSHNHNISIMGGTKHNTYTANASYRNNQGTIIGTGRQEITARANVQQFFWNDKVKLGAEILARQNDSKTGFSPSYVYRQACIQGPTQPIYSEGATVPDDHMLNEKYYTRDVYLYANPISMINEKQGMNRNRNLRFTGNIEIKPIEQLTLKAMYVRKAQNSISGYYCTHDDETTTKGGSNGYASRGASEYSSNMLELTASYVQDFGKHHVTAVAGYSYEDNYTETFSMNNSDFPSDAFSYNNIGLGDYLKQGNAGMSSEKYMSKLIGLFARATYNYDDRYLVMVSYRRDGSSKFGANHKWGNFPGVSAGWRLNNENFLKDVKWIDNLKLRAGFGITGIDAGSPYGSLAGLSYGGTFLYDGRWINTLSPSRNTNENLRWEQKYEYNVGIDFAFFEERLSGSIDLYQRDTKDGLYWYSVPVPPYQYGSIMANVCHIQNRGVEVLINGTPVRTRDFQWNTTLSMSYNANKLVSLQNDEFQMTQNYFYTGYTGEPIQTTTHIVKEGWPLGNFYGLKSVGINKDGLWVVEKPVERDADGNPTKVKYALADTCNPTSDAQVLGNGVPDVYLNFNNTFRYKGFDLAVSMRGAFGFQILNYQKLFYGNPTILYNTLNCAWDELPCVDSRTGQPTGEYSRIKDSQRYVSYYIENGDYWKIDNVTLGWTKNFKNIPLKSLRLYGTIHNLATITGYSGLDPEVRVSYGDNGYDPGTDDRDKYPTIRSYTFGLQITF